MGVGKKVWSTLTAWPLVLLGFLFAGLALGVTAGAFMGGYLIAYRLVLRLFGQ
jgi:hypothetical protein